MHPSQLLFLDLPLHIFGYHGETLPQHINSTLVQKSIKIKYSGAHLAQSSGNYMRIIHGVGGSAIFMRMYLKLTGE